MGVRTDRLAQIIAARDDGRAIRAPRRRAHQQSPIQVPASPRPSPGRDNARGRPRWPARPIASAALGIEQQLRQMRSARSRASSGSMQHAAAGRGDQLRKRPVIGQHRRHAVGPRLEHRQSFALAVDGRRATTRRATAGTRSSRRAIKLAMVVERVPRAARAARRRFELSQVRPIARRRGSPPRAARSGGTSLARGQQLARLDQQVQPLVVADARQDTRCAAARPAPVARGVAVPLQVEPVRNHVHPLRAARRGTPPCKSA